MLKELSPGRENVDHRLNSQQQPPKRDPQAWEHRAVKLAGFRCQAKAQRSGRDLCKCCRKLVLMLTPSALFCLLLNSLISAGKGSEMERKV